MEEEYKAALVQKTKQWFIEELGEEIGQFDAEFLLEFFGRELGPIYYNAGLRDAAALIESQSETIKDTLYTMEEVISL